MSLSPKYRLSENPYNNNLSLTTGRIAANNKAREKEGQIIFNPTLSKSEDLTMYFRIFIDLEAKCNTPAQHLDLDQTPCI